MSTALQDRRLDQRFQLWDANGDGKIDMSDYEAEARRIIQKFNEPEFSPRAHAVIAAYRGMFLYGAQKAGVGPNGALTPEQFSRIAIEALFDRGDEGYAQVLRPCIRSVADLADQDGDGMISMSEFARWMEAIGVETDPGELFQQIDTDGDGELSAEEMVHAVYAYHTGQLQTPLLGA